MENKDYQILLNYCFWLLGKRDYSEAEMKKKLVLRVRKLGSGKEEIPGVLERLKQLKYLDDEKFAERFVADRINFRPKGPTALSFELRRKGISKEIFQKVWNEKGLSEEEIAKHILEGKSRVLEGLPLEKKKKKIVSLLASRGISGSVIYRMIGHGQ